MNKISLVFLPAWSIEIPPVGIAYLSAYLKNNGFDVKCFDFNIEAFDEQDEKSKKLWDIDYGAKKKWEDLDLLPDILKEYFSHKIEEWVDAILKESPFMVGFSIFPNNLELSKKMVKSLKQKNKDIKIVFGGPFFPSELRNKGIIGDIPLQKPYYTYVVDNNHHNMEILEEDKKKILFTRVKFFSYDSKYILKMVAQYNDWSLYDSISIEMIIDDFVFDNIECYLYDRNKKSYLSYIRTSDHINKNILNLGKSITIDIPFKSFRKRSDSDANFDFGDVVEVIFEFIPEKNIKKLRYYKFLSFKINKYSKKNKEETPNIFIPDSFEDKRLNIVQQACEYDFSYFAEKRLLNIRFTPEKNENKLELRISCLKYNEQKFEKMFLKISKFEDYHDYLSFRLVILDQNDSEHIFYTKKIAFERYFYRKRVAEIVINNEDFEGLISFNDYKVSYIDIVFDFDKGFDKKRNFSINRILYNTDNIEDDIIQKNEISKIHHNRYSESKNIDIGFDRCYSDFFVKIILELMKLGVDNIILGEGEATLLMLCKRTNNPDNEVNIPNTLFMKNNRLYYYKSKDENLLNMETLPFPDYSDFDFSKYKKMPITFSRGCRNHCKFCRETAFWKYFRTRSAENIFEEMVFRVKKYYGKYNFNKKMVFFCSESSINTDHKMLKRLCKLIIAARINIDGKWKRLNDIILIEGMARIIPEITIDDYRLFHKAGLSILSFGIESGSDKVLKAMGKGVTSDQALKAIKDARDAEVMVMINLMVGYPEENFIDFLDTLRFVYKCRKYVMIIGTGFPCTIVDQSELYKNSLENNIIFDVGDSLKWRDINNKNTLNKRMLRLNILKIWVKILNIKPFNIISYWKKRR